MFVFAWIPPPVLDPSTWARVDDPDRPDAIARSATGAILANPPTDGTRWRPETLGELTAEEDPTSPGDPARVTNADAWQADGITGAGVKVAVFDLGWFAGELDTARTVGDAETHDCFVTPTCERPFDPLRPNSAAEGGYHGWACAEAIHRVAPDAELHLMRAGSFTLLENAVDWAIRDGVDVISMSMSFYNDSFYDGTGPHDALMQRLTDAGVLMVTSAGNDAALHWQGAYLDADHDDRMDGDGDNAVLLYLERPTAINLVWNQFGPRCGDTDLELRVYDSDGNEVGASDDDVQDPAQDCEPVDVVTPVVQTPDWYRVEVHLRRGVRVGVDVNLIAKGGNFLVPMAEGSLVDPAVHPLAVAVGAVRTTSYWDGPPEGFSSRGPTRNGLQKPEIMGPDGLTTSAFGPVGFFGTSASTPVVVGLIALVMQDDPSLSSREAFERLAGWAHLPSPTPTFGPGTYGAGMARLPVRDPEPARCGERPLWMGVLFVPWGWRRRGRVIGRWPGSRDGRAVGPAEVDRSHAAGRPRG